MSTGGEITADTQVMGNMGYMYVYAKYDKLPVYISYRYVGADGDEKYKETKEPVFMPGDATYGDVETYLQNVSAPEESFGDLVFQKWELASYQDADDPLITSNLYLSALHMIRIWVLFPSATWTAKENGNTPQRFTL